MLVQGVEGATYDELAEIEQKTAKSPMGSVLEVDGDNALVQLLKEPQGLIYPPARSRFLGRSMELGVSADILGRVFDGMGRPN